MIFLGFLLASYISDLELKKLATKKCQGYRKKKTQTLFFWPRDQEMRQLSNMENF